jgi:hypothetical protein
MPEDQLEDAPLEVLGYLGVVEVRPDGRRSSATISPTLRGPGVLRRQPTKPPAPTRTAALSRACNRIDGS